MVKNMTPKQTPETDKRYRDLNSWLRTMFGCRVQKITVDAGFSCPNRDGTLSLGGCIYCNQRGSGTGAHAQGRSVTEQIMDGKAALSRRYKAKKFIAYFQAYTNTYAPVERLRAVYDEALAIDDVVGLSIGTRPDCVADPVLDLLEGYARKHMIWLEYGVQSIHDRTLSMINRGHDFSCAQDAISRTKDRGIYICAHVILGLPDETPDDMIETAKTLGRLGVDGVKIHLLYVVQGTPLEGMYNRGEYVCLTQNQYVDRVCDFLEHLPPEVVIQRLTGDPHPEELVAPAWALEKQATRAAIEDTFISRDIWQGGKTKA